MDENFGLRCAEIRVAWGSLGPHTQATDFAADLGVSVYTLYNRENGCHPQKGLAALEAEYAPLKKRRADVKALALWAWTGAGKMPRPVDLDDRADPRGETISGAVRPATPILTNLRAILEAVKRGSVSLDEAETAIPIVVKASLPGLDSNQESGNAPAPFRVLGGREDNRRAAKIAQALGAVNSVRTSRGVARAPSHRLGS